ncbi:hypothetical protein [Marinobacterium stanieri]|uniref:hypothetical protein n=1 Tax=Marinobacterium stanieri TaxID=49186 RepID=UPI00111253B9|nr:hypothetical protein [Marinobacterium stanieri]
MSKYKARLFALLMVEVVFIGLHKVLEDPVSSYPTKISFEWHFIAALTLGIFIVVYALSIKCPNQSCRERQVFRGWSIFDLCWPEKKCHKCGCSME